ncbi:hypothetical protein AMQ83_36585 [Paenibacillus riograndensis]|nr:hypothetical protein AMQ83_36585 [Paenibacillus riograndensis]
MNLLEFGDPTESCRIAGLELLFRAMACVEADEQVLYKMNLKNSKKGRSAEGKFGTGRANASAFVTGFQPRKAVLIKKSGDNRRSKSKHSPHGLSYPQCET